MDWGADVDHTDIAGCSAFFIACAEGHLEVVKWLATLSPHVDMGRVVSNLATPHTIIRNPVVNLPEQ